MIYICFGIFLDETWSCPQIDFSFCFCFRFLEPTNSILNLLGSSLKLFQNCFKFQALLLYFTHKTKIVIGASYVLFQIYLNTLWQVFPLSEKYLVLKSILNIILKLYFQNKGICKYLNSIFFLKISTNKEFY